MSNPLLQLGSCDADRWPATAAEQKQFKTAMLAKYHAAMAPQLQQKLKFRDEKNNDARDAGWRDFQPLPGTRVSELQRFLQAAGFLPHAEITGVFGYATQAGARLFQEYLRTMEGHAEMVPDGLVGPKTWQHLERWRSQGLTSEWGRFSAQQPTAEYSMWLGLLEHAKNHYRTNPGQVLQHLEKHTRPSASRKIADWRTDAEAIHLIGIRRDQEVRMNKRRNDDLFVLLIRGMVFKFFGSTDPHVDESHGKGRPFLIEGQHSYQFGWHKVANADKVYRALKPSQPGVLVFRDRADFDGALSDAEIALGLDKDPNGTINIHWSGLDSSEFSAGCQVIAGLSYVNHLNKVISCAAFAASGYSQLALGKTRGAYNVFTDLLLCYTLPGVQEISYTLGRDESLFLSEQMGAEYAAVRLNELRDLS